MLDANFWQDKANSKKILKEKKFFEDLINSLNFRLKCSFLLIICKFGPRVFYFNYTSKCN